MDRAFFPTLLAAAALSCSGFGPERATVEGIWSLRTVNGQRLPATSAALQGLVAGGVLRLVAGSTWTEYCVDRGAGQTAPLRRGGGFEDWGNGRGLVLYYSSSGAGSIPTDTLTVSVEHATLYLRQGGAIADTLRLERIGGREMTTAETPSACP
jgi:hypothetical protein